MTTEDLLKTLLGFVLGLLAKAIYDLWSERRKRRRLAFRKILKSSFSIGQLDDEIRQKTEVLFERHPVSSIQLARIEVENQGSSTVKRQAVTIRFGEEATIIGQPRAIGSSEDLRHISLDEENTTRNSYRYILGLLQKGRTVGWDIAVINNPGDFQVEHGVAVAPDAEDVEADLDVASTVSDQPGSVTLRSAIINVIELLVLVQILSLLKSTLRLPGIEDLVVTIFNAGIVFVWIMIIKRVRGVIDPLLEWSGARRGRGELKINNIHESDILVALEEGSIIHHGHELMSGKARGASRHAKTKAKKTE